MTELQLKIWEVATQGGEPQHRRSFVCGEVVEAMGFEWSGDPLGSAPKPKPAPKPAPVAPPVEVVAPVVAPVAPVVVAPAPVVVAPVVEQPAPAPVVEAPVEVAPEPAPVVAEAPPPEVAAEPAPVVEAPPVAEVVEPDPTPDDPNPKPDETPVGELGLTAGVVSALMAAGVNTAGEARASLAADLLPTLPGIGPAKLASIKAALA